MKKVIKIKGKGQASRLTLQQEEAGGPLGIFGKEAQKHDQSIGLVVGEIIKYLKLKYKNIKFRHRNKIEKKEINRKLNSIDKKLGNTIFVSNSSIKPDGGIIEVKDKFDKWRTILIGESKHQGNDVEKILSGIKQGKKKDQDLMVAGNAIERVHKNISECRNFMIDEYHFPYVIFFQGSNFATTTFTLKSNYGKKVTIAHDNGALNRIDRVTASNYGMKINSNYCKNIFVNVNNNSQMLQIPSLHFQCESWKSQQMFKIMLECVDTSLNVLKDSLKL
jgi:type II restriction enzyme